MSVNRAPEIYSAEVCMNKIGLQQLSEAVVEIMVKSYNDFICQSTR